MDRATKKKIVEAIRQAEKGTAGEIRVHVKKTSKGDPLEDARRTFTRLGMHRTRARNGVLILVALESRRFAILGDAGINEKVGASFWERTRDIMAEHFAAGRMGDGIAAGVLSAGEKLREFFPVQPGDVNELSDRVTEG